MSGAVRDEVAVRVRVSGLVQGVFFRASMRDVGAGMGLRGWVRNRADGTVEAHLQGRATAVQAMVDWCRQGPPYARVESLVRDDVPIDPALTTFSIKP